MTRSSCPTGNRCGLSIAVAANWSKLSTMCRGGDPLLPRRASASQVAAVACAARWAAASSGLTVISPMLTGAQRAADQADRVVECVRGSRPRRMRRDDSGQRASVLVRCYTIATWRGCLLTVPSGRERATTRWAVADRTADLPIQDRIYRWVLQTASTRVESVRASERTYCPNQASPGRSSRRA